MRVRALPDVTVALLASKLCFIHFLVLGVLLLGVLLEWLLKLVHFSFLGRGWFLISFSHKARTMAVSFIAAKLSRRLDAKQEPQKRAYMPRHYDVLMMSCKQPCDRVGFHPALETLTLYCADIAEHHPLERFGHYP